MEVREKVVTGKEHGWGELLKKTSNVAFLELDASYMGMLLAKVIELYIYDNALFFFQVGSTPSVRLELKIWRSRVTCSTDGASQEPQ